MNLTKVVLAIVSQTCLKCYHALALEFQEKVLYPSSIDLTQVASLWLQLCATRCGLMFVPQFLSASVLILALKFCASP